MDGDPRQASISLPVFRALTDSAPSVWREALEQAMLAQLDSIIMVQDAWSVLTENTPSINQKRCFISSLWRGQVFSLHLPVLCKRIEQQIPLVDQSQQNLLEQGLQLLSQLAVPVKQKTPHHNFNEFASAYCGDQVWQLPRYSTDASGLFESWGAGKLDISPLIEAMMLTAMNELWSFGEKSFAEPLVFKEAVFNEKLTTDSSHAENHQLRLPHQWFEHSAATNFQLAIEALQLIAKALDWQPDEEALKKLCQGYIRRKAAIMASLMEMLLQPPEWLELQLTRRA